jgi:heme-degrading monooxygenase HmoA
MYIAVRKYYIHPGAVEEWMRRVQEGFVPLIKEMPGFLAYYALKVREDEAVTISIFETQKGAELSVQQAAEWVAKHLVSLLQTFPEIIVGQVRVSEVSKEQKIRV